MKSLVCRIGFVILVCASCSKKQFGTDANPHTIVWKFNVDASKITYQLDGRSIGEGVTGLENALSFLNGCKPEEIIRIEASRQNWNDLDAKAYSTDPLAMAAFRVQGLGQFETKFDKITNRLKLQFRLVNLNYSDK